MDDKFVVFFWGGLTVINLSNISSFQLLIYLVLHSLDMQMSQTLQPLIYQK